MSVHFPPWPETFSGMLIIRNVLFTVMRVRWFMLFAVILSALVIFGGCNSTTPPSTVQPPSDNSQPTQSGLQPVQSTGPSGVLTISVDSLSPGSVLPDVYTCKGVSKSPEVSWSNIPAAAKSLVLILDDPDAPGGTFTHWLVYNIPPRSGGLAEGQLNVKVLSNDAQHGEGSTGLRGYFPPCPPVGSQHRYIFHLYAADINLPLPTADRAAIDQALNGHILAKTEFTTTYKR